MKYQTNILFTRATGSEPREYTCAHQPRGISMAAMNWHTSGMLVDMQNIDALKEAAMF